MIYVNIMLNKKHYHFSQEAKVGKLCSFNFCRLLKFADNIIHTDSYQSNIFLNPTLLYESILLHTFRICNDYLKFFFKTCCSKIIYASVV